LGARSSLLGRSLDNRGLIGISRSTSPGGAIRATRVLLLVTKREGTELRELVEGESLTFGRSTEATIALDDEKVSRIHLRIRREHGAVIVEDLGSRNGTKVNGNRLSKSERFVLGGDSVRVGASEILVVQAGEGSDGDIDAEGTILAGERKAELVVRAHLFVRRFAKAAGIEPPKIERDARSAIASYQWPAVAALKSAIEHAMKRTSGGPIRAEHLPPAVRTGPPTLNERAPAELEELRTKLLEGDKKGRS
jgi:pSer/pThr/pTyr-binding forkhead associated (FHA) protein